MKVIYDQAHKKLEVRTKIFSRFTRFNRLIGLAGPNLDQYVKFFASQGIKDFQIWENNRQTLLHQIVQSSNHINLKLNFGDILNAPVRTDTLYDLDFCGLLPTFRDHLIKFRKATCILTVCTRDIHARNKEDSIHLFLSYRGQLCKRIEWNGTEGIVTTRNHRQYGIAGYLSHVNSPMMMIYPIS